MGKKTVVDDRLAMGQTYATAPGFMAKPAYRVRGGERQGLGNQPTNVGRRRAQFSVVRGTTGSHRTLPQQECG